MADPNQQIMDAGNLPASVSGQLTVAAVLLSFALFVVVLILYLRAKGYSGAIGSTSRRSRRLIFAPQEPTHPRRALDPSVLSSLPITTFISKADDNGDDEDGCCECAVCICELDDGEKIRALPKCGHVFHVECIDMWFHSNDTCPLCRSLVCGPDEEAEAPSVEVVIHPPLPLEAVTEAGASSSSSAALSSSSRRRKEGMLVIDVPRRINGGGFSSSSVGNTPLPTSRVPSSNTPLPSSRVPSNSPLPTSRLLEEMKSPNAFGAVRSLRSMLSRGSFKGASCSHSHQTAAAMGSSYDLEQGMLAESKCQ